MAMKTNNDNLTVSGQGLMNLTKRKSHNLCKAAVLAALSTVASASLMAQEAPAEEEKKEAEVERILVTVERRSQDLQDLAGTAFAFSGEDLKSQGIQDITDIAESIPGLEIGNNQGNVEVWIRGIGSSNNTELGDPAAATHLDGVYIPRPSGIGSAFFDISRVEVNIGPQGTLRGRNATAGSVNIIPWRPALGQWNGSAEVEFGNYNHRSFSGALNIPVTDRLAFRVAGTKVDHDSYYNDVGPLDLELAEAADNLGLRFQALYEATDDLTFYFSYDYAREQGTGYTGTNFALPLGLGIDPDDIEDPRDVIGRGFTPIQDTVHDGFKFEARWDMGKAILEYNGSYRDLLYDYQAATPLSPDFPGVFEALEPLAQGLDDFSRFQFLTDSESTIHELRLLSDDDASRLTYTAGLFIFQERQQTFLASAGDRGGFFQGAEFNQPNTDTDSFSAYADATYEFSPDTRLTLGLRYTEDTKTRQGVNARYAFALGGFDVNTGNEFGCCMGARVGTEGFAFAGFDRTIYDPDTDGSGAVSDQEFLEFYFNGIAQFGRRDTLDDIFANGVTPGGADVRPACTDTDSTDSLICNQDGTYSFAVPISPDNSITIQDGRIDNSFVDWRIRAEHDLSRDNLIYGLIATGHKAGGFNDTFNDPTSGITLAPTYQEESVTLFEFGSKNEFDLGDVPTTFNFSAFYNDYRDQVFTNLLSVEQALEFNSGAPADPLDATPGALVVSFSFNAADSAIYGIQFDGKFELPYDVNLKWTALWLEAEIEDSQDIQDSRFQADVAPDEAIFQSIDGNRLPRTPKYQLNAALSQTFDFDAGSLDYVVSVGWRDDQFLTIFNSVDYQFPDAPRRRLDDSVDAYWTMDAGFGYSHGDGALRIEAYANNLFNEVQTAATIITQFDNTRFFTRPRTFGVRVRYTY
jgi:iron complex outermembrane receptor protein